jgi:hypothetical protein
MTDLCTLEEIMMSLCIRSFRLFLLATAKLKPRGHRQLLEGEGGRVPTGADNDSESRAGQIDLDAENVVVARGKLSAAGREVQGGLEVGFRSRLLIRN